MRAAAVINERAFKALLRAAATRSLWWAPRDHALIYVLGKTGLRITEALALTAADCWTDGPGPCFLRVKTLKQRKPRTDEVLLDVPAARTLRRYIDRTLPGLVRLAGYTLERAAPLPLFPALRVPAASGAFPSPMTRFRAAQVIRFYVRLAGLPRGVSAHSLRHYRGTQLLRLTGDLEFTRQQLRHADVRNTQRYQHADPARVAGYLSKVAAAEDL